MLRKSLLVVILVLAFAGLANAQDSLTVGESVEGTAEGKALAFSLDAKEGEAFLVTLSSNDFDTHVAIEDADGKLVTENEDVYDYNLSTYYNSRSLFIAPADGTYSIVASAVYGDFKGAFTLVAESVEYTALEYGSTVKVSEESPVNYFVFSGKEGDIVNLFAIGEDQYADSQLSLQSSGTEIAYDYDGGKGYNANIHRYTLPSDGTFVAVLSGYNNEPLKDTTVTLEKTEALALTAEGAEVSLGEDFDYENFTVDFKVGEVYTLNFSSDSPVNLTIEVTEEGESYYSKYVSFTDLLKGSATFTVNGSGTGKIKVTSNTFDPITITLGFSAE